MNASGEYAPVPTSDTKTKKLLKIALAAGFLAALVTAAEFAYLIYGPSAEAHQLAVSFGPAPVGPLVTLDSLSKMSTTTVIIHDASGTAYQVLDSVLAGDARYLILFTEKRPWRSDVFVQSASGQLTQLTDSETMKYGLSYAQNVGGYMFESLAYSKNVPYSANTAWDIEFAASTSSPPKKVASGIHTYLLPDATGYLLRDQKTLSFHSLNDESAAPVKLLDIEPGTLLAVSTETSSIALGNTVTGAIDTYTYKLPGATSYVTSYTPEYGISALAYIGKKLLAAGVIQQGGMTEYQIHDLPGSNRTFFDAPAASSNLHIVTIKEL